MCFVTNNCHLRGNTFVKQLVNQKNFGQKWYLSEVFYIFARKNIYF